MNWMNWKTWTTAALVIIAVFAIYTFAPPDGVRQEPLAVSGAQRPARVTSVPGVEPVHMKQYARSIKAFQAKNGNALPVSIDQIKKARQPRLIRGVNSEWVDPLTGKVDWLLVPPAAANQPRGITPPNQQQSPLGGDSTTTRPTQGVQVGSPKDYVGPFVGVRPPIEGESLLQFNGAQRYEEWLYTTTDLDNEINGIITPAPNAPPPTKTP